MWLAGDAPSMLPEPIGVTALDFEYINADVNGGLAMIELNRPTVLNALSSAMSRELLSAITRFSEDRAVRAVLLRGAGRAFCAGADLAGSTAGGPANTRTVHSRLDDVFHPIIATIRTAPKPFVAAINGPCVGLGVALALACDLTLAETSAYFLLPFVRLGLSLDGGVSAFLTDRIGLARATELTMMGNQLPAETAAAWGMINRVCAPEELQGEAYRLALKLAAGPTLALSNIKRALSAAAHPRLREQLGLESRLQVECTATADYQEGRAAFRARREPVFGAEGLIPAAADCPAAAEGDG